MAPQGALPSGTVTFLFTDIEGSTALLKHLGRDDYARLLGEHSKLLRAVVREHGGQVIDTQGDSLFCAFRSAREAVSASAESQRRLAGHEWPEQVRVRVRMGLHSSEPMTSEEGYVGIGVHRAARIGAAAHGGQVLLSETARALVVDDLPSGVSLRDLGVHRLKDIDEPVRLYQVVAAGLERQFPPPRTLPGGRRRRTHVALAVAGLVVAAGVLAAVLLTTGSASAKPVRLLANSIAVVDPKTAKPVADVPLGFSPTDVDAGGNKIWVLNGARNTVTAIDPATLKVGQPIGLDADPFSQYATGGGEWVGILGGVDEIENGGVSRILLWKPPVILRGGNASGSPCFVYVTGHGRRVWVAEGQHLAVLDAASGSVLRERELPAAPGFPPGSTCYGIRYSDGTLLAIRSADVSLGAVDPASSSFIPVATDLALATVSFTSSNWVAGFGSYWIGTYRVETKTARAVDVLDRLDRNGGEVMSSVVAAHGFGSLTADPASGIWALGGPGRTLVRVDPSTGQVTHTIPLHHTPCCPNGAVGDGVAVGHGRLWVAIDSP